MESKINQCKEKHQRLTWLWFPQWLALHHFICLLNTQASRRGILERHLGLETGMFSIEQTQGRNLSPSCIVYTENGQNNKPSSSSLLSVLKNEEVLWCICKQLQRSNFNTNTGAHHYLFVH